MKRPSPHLSTHRESQDPGSKLLSDILPHIGQEEDEALRRRIRRFGSRHDLRTLLAHGDTEVVRAAAVCLGWVGTFSDTASIAARLHHDDYFVVKAAEEALWAIWMRSSLPPHRDKLCRAVQCLNDEDFDSAETLLDQLLHDDPDFAEACNQRAILYYLTGRHRLSVLACHRTLLLNQHHFGAAAGLGHNHFQLGEYEAALAAYRRALNIYPRMEGVRQAMRRTREAQQACGDRAL